MTYSEYADDAGTLITYSEADIQRARIDVAEYARAAAERYRKARPDPNNFFDVWLATRPRLSDPDWPGE